MTDPVPEASVLTRSEPTEADFADAWGAACEGGYDLQPYAIDNVVRLIWQRAQAALPVPADRSGESK